VACSGPSVLLAMTWGEVCHTTRLSMVPASRWTC